MPAVEIVRSLIILQKNPPTSLESTRRISSVALAAAAAAAGHPEPALGPPRLRPVRDRSLKPLLGARR